ncbi:crotonobetainyl-CoA:carnitine CoA-transferase CaiB-like acyl-CoA transferase [Nitrobacteraceae bacterium AZCC 1564]
MDTTPAEGAMGGVCVIDFTSIMMGSYAAHILADVSADMIKIESVGA